MATVMVVVLMLATSSSIGYHNMRVMLERVERLNLQETFELAMSIRGADLRNAEKIG